MEELVPEFRYARAGRYAIAYQTFGAGPVDLVLVDQWFSNVDAMWRFQPLADLLRRLARFARVIVFDKRGTGLSDPIAIDALPTVEEWIDDLRAVLDDAGSTRSALMTGVGASLMAIVFAATDPERTSSLVLVDPFARATWAEDNQWGYRIDRLEADLARIRDSWGTRAGTMALLAPELLSARPLAQEFLRYERASAAPGMATAMIRWMYDVDVRHVLPTIRVPTLVLHHADATRIAPAHGRYVAQHIPGARFAQLPGSANYTWAGDTSSMLVNIEAFLTGSRPALEPDRVLATVLFTDIVDSTRLAGELGDARWRQMLAKHDRAARDIVESFRGRVIKSTGDGVLATFDGPARAVRAAAAIGAAVDAHGIRIRSGLHTGEIEIADADVVGIAVHLAARISALAGPGEILTSSTVRDLVAGSGIAFESRGSQVLKGIDDEWRVFAARP
jgi:class 3 adenylate cyclase